jgi:alkylhydroperoxidase family enzyme
VSTSALALTEAATRLSDRPGAVTDQIWAEAPRHYDERQLGALVLMVAIGSGGARRGPIPAYVRRRHPRLAVE